MSAMTAHVENHAAKTAQASTAQASTAQASKAFRDVAEKSTAQAKENYEKMSAPAAAAADLMKIAYSTTFKGAQDYSAKVIEFAHVNTNAAFEYARQLSSVKSPAEFFALSNGHLRQQYEIVSRQAQELAAIAQKVTAATTESVKAGVDRAA
jgi:phasin